MRENVNTVLNGKVRPISVPQPFLYKIVFLFDDSIIVLVGQIKHPLFSVFFFIFALLGNIL